MCIIFLLCAACVSTHNRVSYCTCNCRAIEAIPYVSEADIHLELLDEYSEVESA